LDEAPEAEVYETEQRIVDQATAARTIRELEIEIESLKALEGMARELRHSGTDRKWEELSSILQDNAEMFDAHGHRRKLIVFSEQRDTVTYLTNRIRTLIGRPEAVVVIHGSLGREHRRKAQEVFTQDKDVQFLVATDAAGEGINLQRAHLVVNYDLPWNPNRLEQRFGRVHRIGQTEVCHMWNLVAGETREGEVYLRLLQKIEQQEEALGGKVFDVLGKGGLLGGTPLRKLLIEAIRYGDQPEVRARLHQVIDEATDQEHVKELLEERALAHDSMDASQVRQVREDMERAEARKLQPHFIRSLFVAAFGLLGGTIRQREPQRYEITHVPATIRSRDRQIGRGQPVLTRYERVCFEKDQINVPGKPTAAFICPGHPLLDATIDLVLERHRDLLKRGAVLVAADDESTDIRALFYLEHSIQDARPTKSGDRRVVSREMQFVEIDEKGNVTQAGYAPYLDYEPIKDEDRQLVASALEDEWLTGDLEDRVLGYAVEHMVPRHLAEVRKRKEELVDKTFGQVKDRLTKEINYWDHRAEVLKAQELAGKTNARINSGRARQRADELQARLQRRLKELEQERQLAALPPVVIGGAVVVPIGLIKRLKGEEKDGPDAESRKVIEQKAMEAVMAAERALGREPHDVSSENRGYDIESRIAGDGRLLFIEVKGRAADAGTVNVSKNEILTGLNKPNEFILAVVLVQDGQAQEPRYIRRPFGKEPDFGVTSVNYDLNELLARGESPS
jgi:hypothetical protein